MRNKGQMDGGCTMSHLQIKGLDIYIYDMDLEIAEFFLC